MLCIRSLVQFLTLCSFIFLVFPSTYQYVPSKYQVQTKYILVHTCIFLVFPSTYQYVPSKYQVQTKYILVHTCESFEIASTNKYILSVSYTENYRDLQQNYRDVQGNYSTRDFELECSISAPVRSSVHRNGTYPTLKTFPLFLNYRSFEGVEAPEGCENVA
jgi:hypothetical protein